MSEASADVLMVKSFQNYSVRLTVCYGVKLLKQGYRYKLRKAFSKFYRRHSGLVVIYNVSLKKLLQQGISGPEFYDDLVYRFREYVGKSIF